MAIAKINTEVQDKKLQLVKMFAEMLDTTAGDLFMNSNAIAIPVIVGYSTLSEYGEFQETIDTLSSYADVLYKSGLITTTGEFEID